MGGGDCRRLSNAGNLADLGVYPARLDAGRQIAREELFQGAMGRAKCPRKGLGRKAAELW